MMAQQPVVDGCGVRRAGEGKHCSLAGSSAIATLEKEQIAREWYKSGGAHSGYAVSALF